jgi:hypothetical protein
MAERRTLHSRRESTVFGFALIASAAVHLALFLGAGVGAALDATPQQAAAPGDDGPVTFVPLVVLDPVSRAAIEPLELASVTAHGGPGPAAAGAELCALPSATMPSSGAGVSLR